MGNKSSCIFCIFCFVLFASPLVVLITLRYVGVESRLYIQEIYIPSLNTIFNATNLNTSIFIDLKFKRVVAYVPIYYEDVNITLFYASNTSFSVGYGFVPRFGQDKKKTVHRKVVVEGRRLPWEDALQKISGGSTVALAVEVATKYSQKHCNDHCYFTKPKTVAVAAEVRLDGSGHKVSKKPIRLH